MNRCGFISSLSSSSGIDIEDCILNYFNETMLLYNLFGNCDNVKVSVNGNVINPFRISFNSKEDAVKMNDSIDGMILHIYNNKYIVGSKIDDKSLNVSLDMIAAGMD